MNGLLRLTGSVNKRNTSFYLTEETHALIRRLAEARVTSKNHIVESAVKALAESDREPIEDEPTTESTEWLEDMRDQVQFLRRELERKDTIIMALTQRVPELEPISEPTREPERPRDRPWWVRLIGG